MSCGSARCDSCSDFDADHALADGVYPQSPVLDCCCALEQAGFDSALDDAHYLVAAIDCQTDLADVPGDFRWLAVVIVRPDLAFAALDRRVPSCHRQDCQNHKDRIHPVNCYRTETDY